MWHHVFTLQIPLAEKLLRTVLVYALESGAVASLRRTTRYASTTML